MPQVIYEMWKMKMLGMFKTMQTTDEFVSNLAAIIC